MSPATLSLPEPLPAEYFLDLHAASYTLRCFDFKVSSEGIDFRLLALGAAGNPHPVQRNCEHSLLSDSASSVTISAMHAIRLDIEIVSTSEHHWPEWSVARFAAELRVRVDPPRLESDVLIIARSHDHPAAVGTLVLPLFAVRRAFRQRLTLDVAD